MGRFGPISRVGRFGLIIAGHFGRSFILNRFLGVKVFFLASLDILYAVSIGG